MPCCPATPAMNWMNTSSRLVSAGATAMPGARATSASAASSAAGSRPTTCSDGAERRHLVDARRRRAAGRASASSPGPVTTKVCSPDRLDHLGDGALGDQPAVGDVADPVAALGLVHVVGRDQHGDAAGGEPWISSQNSRRALGSTPAVGSSSSSSCGACMMQAASASRCFQPPDSLPASCCRAAWSARASPACRAPPRAGRAAGRARRRGRGSPRSSGPRRARTSASCSRPGP